MAIPSAQMEDDIKQLNALGSADAVGEFCKILISWVISPAVNDLKGAVSAFAAKHGISGKIVKACMRGFLVYIQQALQQSRTPTQVESDLKLSYGVQHAQTIGNLWKADFMALSRSVIAKTLTVNDLVDMQWRFGATASSDELESIGSTFLQLKLTISSSAASEGEREQVFMELSLPQFYEFLGNMKKASAAMDFLSV